VGYGDYMPKNVNEFGLIVIIMLAGVGCFAYIMGSFNSAVQDYNSLTSGDDNLSNLNIWLDSLEDMIKLNPKFKQQILDHYIYYFSKDRLRFLAKCHWRETPI
jgi:hypothetical protein